MRWSAELCEGSEATMRTPVCTRGHAERSRDVSNHQLTLASAAAPSPSPLPAKTPSRGRPRVLRPRSERSNHTPLQVFRRSSHAAAGAVSPANGCWHMVDVRSRATTPYWNGSGGHVYGDSEVSRAPSEYGMVAQSLKGAEPAGILRTTFCSAAATRDVLCSVTTGTGSRNIR
jgi:hypothetical protein